MSTGIPRKDPLVDEAIEILDQHFKRCKHDPKEAWDTLSSVHLQFINDELRKCLVTPRYYLENYHVVKTEHQGFRTLHPFWDSQEIIYSEIMSLVNAGKPAKVLCDKARQLGSSTLSEGLVFHKTIFTEALNALIVAQDPDQADYLFSMSVRAYENLPWWMQPATRYHSKGRYMVFGSEMIGQTSLNSEIFVAASNKLTGPSVGKTIRSAHLSELSAWADAKTLTQAIFPTMNSPDTLAILESTARGRQGFWYDFWKEAVSRWGDGSWEWKPIFVEWFRCPDKYSKKIENRNTWTITEDERLFREKVLRETRFYIPDEMLNWKRMKIQETISIEGDQWSHYQEFPSTWQESFQSTGLCAFPKKKLQQIMETVCCPPRWYGEIYYSHGAATEVKTHLTEVWNDKGMIPGVQVPPAEYNGSRLRVWEMPEAGESYYLAADPAQGLEGKGDFSCIEILRIGHGGAPDVQVAEWHGWINPTPFGHIIVGMAKWYNNCEVAVELNSVGEKTYIEVFRILEYPNLFRWKHYDKVKNYYTDYMAWVTNHKTRDLIIANFRERVMEGTVTLYSYDLLNEMMDFSAEEEGERFEGQSTNDDRCFTPETLIRTGQGMTKIADVKVGDGVLGHDGYWHRVDATGRRCVDEEIVKIKTWGVPVEIRCTVEHPILVKKRRGPGCPARFHERGWTNAGGIEKKDAIFVPVAPLMQPPPLTDDELYFLGWCLADGHAQVDGGSVKITFAKDEMGAACVIKDIMQGLVEKHPTESHCGVRNLGTRFHHSIVNLKEHSRWITVSVGNLWLSQWIRRWIGDPRRKKIHPAIRDGAGTMPFVVGFLEGDGSQKNSRSSIDVVQKNAPVLYDIRDMMLRHGVWAGMSPKLTKDKQARLYLGVPWLNKLLSIFPGAKFRQVSRIQGHPIARWEGNGFQVIVKSVEREHYDGFVHNLSVENSHSYTANEIAVHNCMAAMICTWCAHDSDYGKQAAMQPRNDGIGVRKFYLVDDQGRVMGEHDQRDVAIAAGMTTGDNPVFRRGWSVVSRMSRKDFINSDFSPVHDRPGPRQQMHYVHGVPAENIRLDNIYDPEVSQEESDWRCL